MSQQEKAELIERQTAYRGYFQIGIYRYRHSLFGGGQSAILKREVFERGPVAAVLPYDPIRDRVALIRQIRVGPLATGQPPWIWETVAGIIEPGETPEDVARREAMEEAAIEIGALIPMHGCFLSPGGSSEFCSSFLGRAALEGNGGIHGLASEGEDILVRIFDWDEARAMLDRGELASATGTMALQWLALNRQRVRAEWH